MKSANLVGAVACLAQGEKTSGDLSRCYNLNVADTHGGPLSSQQQSGTFLEALIDVPKSALAEAKRVKRARPKKLA